MTAAVIFSLNLTTRSSLTSATLGIFISSSCCLVTRSMTRSMFRSRGLTNRMASPRAARAARAADAMHVGFGVVRDVVVEHVRDALDVETARRHVGGDQDVDLAVLELRDHLFALALFHVAVQRGGREAARFEALREIDGFDLGAHEHEHGVEAFGFEHARERVELVQAADHPVTLADLRRGFATRLHADLARIAHVRLRDAADGMRQRRGEQRHLLVFRRLLEQEFDVVDEAHLQHLVAFVEHEELEVLERERAALHVVEQRGPGCRRRHARRASGPSTAGCSSGRRRSAAR